MNLTKEQIEIANDIDTMMFYLANKRVTDTVPVTKDQTMFNAVAQEIGHTIIHTLTGKCSDVETVEFNKKVELGQSMAALFLIGVYMAEHGMAKLGEPEKKEASELQ